MTIVLTLVGMALVTIVPRVLPLLLLSTRKLPAWLRTWLEYIPVAVLAAMLLPTLVTTDGCIDLTFDNLFLWLSIPCFVVAWRTRSLLGTVGTGLALVMAARWLGW
ncbi:MAG: AzlD domain-containing protein [Chloroflexi bacterium]|nr:AzlD domain-containing protein [Chloroflexota bacterium]